MLKMLLCAIIVLSLSALYVSRKKASRAHFDVVTDSYLYFALVHALFVLVADFFSSLSFAGLLLPFGLAYGPFFYIGLRSFSGEVPSKRQLLLHFIPFFVIALASLGFLYELNDYEEHLFSFFYLLTALSLAGYAVWMLTFDRASMKLKNIIAFAMAATGLLFAAIVVSKPLLGQFKAELTASVIMYGGIMVSVAMLFQFKVIDAVAANAVEQKASKHTAVQEDEIQSEATQGKYSKSGLATPLLKEYKERLDRLFEEDHSYLDNDLTLVLLADKLKIPAHHLTQLFNVYIGENFNQYVNKFRIDYACMMLADADEDVFIEDVAFKSGFNSKVSFNRHFKNITGCTPKEYVYKMRR